MLNTTILVGEVGIGQNILEIIVEFWKFSTFFSNKIKLQWPRKVQSNFAVINLNKFVDNMYSTGKTKPACLSICIKWPPQSSILV